MAQRKLSAAFTLQPNCGVEAIVKAAVQQTDVRPVIVAHALQLPLMGADGKRSRMGRMELPDGPAKAVQEVAAAADGRELPVEVREHKRKQRPLATRRLHLRWVRLARQRMCRRMARPTKGL